MSAEYSTRVLTDLGGLTADSWNRLTPGNNPFLSHEYLYGLEQEGCLTGHGWSPQHLAIYAGESLVGAMPLYLRTNSHGEFVFDWAWADAYEQAGGRYYPKLVSAIPFAPVIGPRLLVSDNHTEADKIRESLARQLVHMTDTGGLSSSHCLFTAGSDQSAFRQAGFMPRLTCQFHWHNKDYRDFDDFLDTLTSKKRKQIKRERRLVAEHGIDIEVLTGDQISESQWQTYYQFYCSTFLRRWGNPRLTLDFFRMLGKQLPASTLLILARRGDDYVAGAFAMLGTDTLYGRHWGCAEQYPFLHFELCYYQTIDYAIRHRLQHVDAGVQGEHKLARGFEPVAGISWHWIRHAGFRQAIEDYLIRETGEMNRYIDSLRQQLPFRQSTADEQA